MKRSRVWIRALLGVVLVAACLAAALAPVLSPAIAAPVQAPPTHIVISEFRSSGSGSALNDEFVELYNPTAGALTISAGWSLARSSDCQADSNGFYTFPADVTLAAGQHYLIGGTGYSGSVTPDVANVNISVGNKGGIGLLDNTTPTPLVVDQVGMCNLDQYLEGTALATFPGASDQSYDRISVSNSCQDTNNNAADFFLRQPSDPQNFSDPLTNCGNPTATPSITPSPTNTSSGYNPPVIINEIAWSGTNYQSFAEWIELYNNTGADINLNSWRLYSATDSSPDITLTGTIPKHGYYLLMAVSSAQATAFATATAAAASPTPTACLTFNASDLANVRAGGNVAIQYYYGTGQLFDGGEKLFLQDNGVLIDSANSADTAWRAGSTTNHASMERRGVVPDTSSAWITYANPGGNTSIRDCNGNRIYGTPGQPNWSNGQLQTPSPTPTHYKRPTSPPPTPFAHMVINEFLPRAGFDWNQDGAVDVFDEFIEIKNLGPIDASLSGWRLDVISPGGASAYSLPAQTLKPGQHALYYGLTSHISLYDSGGTIRLINNRGVIVDARSYGAVGAPDVSHCRIPDGGYWQTDCFPTPGLDNALTGTTPMPPPVIASQPPPCLMADTVPAPFRQAECNPFGAEVYNPAYWDSQSGFKEFTVPDVLNKNRAVVQ